MQMVTVTGAQGATFPIGTVLVLTQDQADPRRHMLSTVVEPKGKKPGRYRVEQAVVFKRGEELGLVDAIPKGLHAVLQYPAPAEPVASPPPVTPDPSSQAPGLVQDGETGTGSNADDPSGSGDGAGPSDDGIAA